MKQKKISTKGFTLVELLVIIAVISILSISTVSGFESLRQTLRLQETTQYLTDLISQAQLKILRGDYKKTTLHFFEHFIMADHEISGAELELKIGENCVQYIGLQGIFTYGFESTVNGTLISTDNNGNTKTYNLVANQKKCDIDLLQDENTKLTFELRDGDKFSNQIEVSQFNLQRNPPENPIQISVGAKSKMEILPPYGKKIITDNNQKIVDATLIYLKDKSTEKEQVLKIE